MSTIYLKLKRQIIFTHKFGQYDILSIDKSFQEEANTPEA